MRKRVVRNGVVRKQIRRKPQPIILYDETNERVGRVGRRRDPISQIFEDHFESYGEPIVNRAMERKRYRTYTTEEVAWIATLTVEGVEKLRTLGLGNAAIMDAAMWRQPVDHQHRHWPYRWKWPRPELADTKETSEPPSLSKRQS